MTVKEETIDDALAAAALLEKTKGIDRKRVFILGHSLGGFLMPRIAVAAEPLKLAGFISMAGLTRPLDDTILRQMTYLYGLAGAAVSEDDKKKLEDLKVRGRQDQGPHRRRQELDDEAHGRHAGLLARSPRLRPARDGQGGRKPMLILQGGRDYQVTTEDLENWKKALGGRKDVEFHLYPKLNHLFFEGEGIITPLEYMQKHGSVAPYVIDDIATWISKH